LRVAAPGRPRLDRYALYRCAWAMLFQVKVQELQQHFGVLHRHRQAKGANPAIRNRRPLFFLAVSVFMHVQLKAQSYLIGGKRTRHQTRRELLQQPV